MLFGYASLLISLARNILFVPFYLHRIPLAEYGAWLATGGALALILINDYGVAGVVTQRMSANFGAGRHDALGILAGSAVAIGVLMAMALSALSLACLPLLPRFEALSGTQNHIIVQCFMAAIAANGLGVIGATATSVIRSLQKVILNGLIAVGSELANVAVILLGLFAGWGLYAIAAGALVRSLIIASGGLVGVWHACVRGLKTKVEIRGNAVRDLFAESSRFFLTAIAMKLQSQANVFFVGAILGPTNAAIYSLTVRAHETVIMLISAINGSLIPSMTHLFGSGNSERFRAVILRLLVSIMALTAMAMTVTVVLNPGFLRLWVGSSVFGGQGVSILMAAALFLASTGAVAYDALLAQGRFGLVSRVFALSSLLQVLLLVLLLRLGIACAPVATMISTGFWGCAFWSSVRSDIGITRGDLRQLLADLALFVSISAAVATVFVTFYPDCNSWTALVVEGSLCSGCLCAGYLLFSARLRKIALQEIGTTLNVFRTA